MGRILSTTMLTVLVSYSKIERWNSGPVNANSDDRNTPSSFQLYIRVYCGFFNLRFPQLSSPHGPFPLSAHHKSLLLKSFVLHQSLISVVFTVDALFGNKDDKRP